jgi:hypothetical protein
MPFGRYRGRELGELPTDYLLWLSGIDLEPWLRHGVEAERLRRGHHHHQPRAETTPAPQLPIRPILTQWFAEMSRKFHPDSGGTTEAMAAINTGYERLRQLLGMK